MHRASALSTTAAVAAAAIALVGCGSTAHHAASGTHAVRHPPSAPSRRRSGAAFAKLPATTILADATDSLAVQSAYRFAGTVIQAGRPVQATFDVHAPAAVSATIVRGPSSEQIVTTGTQADLRANLAFWQEQDPTASAPIARDLAGRWFSVPAADASVLTGTVKLLMPAGFARCLKAAMAAPRHAGQTTVAGQPAVLLASAGAPGSDPGELVVASTGTHVPLAYTQTGPRRAGTNAACGASPISGGTHDRLTFSDFGTVTVSLPAGATALP